MKFNRINLQVLDKIGMLKLSLKRAEIPLFLENPSKDIYDFIHSKNVILSGEFFPLSENSFKEKLIEREANVQQEITPETEILICGRYPDWMLVEEARLYGIRIIFADKAGESFSKIATKLCKSRPVLSYEQLLGV